MPPPASHGRHGRGRTADLPIFSSLDSSSLNTVNVRDLHHNIDLNTNERRRTQANETKDETNWLPWRERYHQHEVGDGGAPPDLVAPAIVL
jgi:hypothetical protein